MPALYLTEADVRDLLDMEIALSAVEEAFRQLAQGRAQNEPRARVRGDRIMLHSMSASADYLGVVGWKCYTTTPRGARFLVGIYSSQTGELIALIEADYLGQLRTGAASGVATAILARPDSRVVGLFGSGAQARTQLQAVCHVRRIEQVEVYSRQVERCQIFADEMGELCRTRIVPVRSPNGVAADKDIVICATTAHTPLFEGHALSPGTHLNVIGSNHLNKTEIDVTTVHRADTIVCDSLAQCRIEAGDFVQALEEGAADWANMYELSEVLTGRAPGRSTAEQITLFKSVGLAIEDLALAARLLELARSRNVGQALPF
ncbi:MAG TPA: ornithine cyclodeaminase [Planctomycetaceae bacterium]|nr:ornithine cyclodeaminase [Planctomycetaceae bacterium]